MKLVLILGPFVAGSCSPVRLETVVHDKALVGYQTLLAAFAFRMGAVFASTDMVVRTAFLEPTDPDL